MDFTLDTLETGEIYRERKIHVVLHNKVLAVLRRPELDTVVFAKRTDQSFQFLWNKKIADNQEVYDLESGSLRYHCFDYLRGMEITNIVGHAELAREGKEICCLLRLAHDAYEQETAKGQILTRDIPVNLYIQGDLVPYAIRVKERNATVRLLGHSIPSLRLWAYPLAHRGNRAYGCESWTVSFRELAECVAPRCLEALRGDIAEWIMIPLIADLDLPLGAIHGVLTEFSVVPQPSNEISPAAH